MDIAEIVSSSVAEAGGSEESGEQTTETTETPTETPAETPAEAPKADEDEGSEEELGPIEKDLLEKNPKLSENTIAAHRHQAVVTNLRRKHEAAVAKAVEEAKAAHQQELQDLAWAKDPETHYAFQAMQLAATDPKKFVELLMKEQSFQDLIQLKEARQEQQHTTRPGGNAKLESGEEAYYGDGLTQLLDWHSQNVSKAVEAKLVKQMEETYGPVRQEYQARNVWNQKLDSTRQTLDRARAEWDGFKENEAAIGQALKANPNWGLEDAYRSVVIKSFKDQAKVNREALRKELLAEINSKGRAAGVERPGGGVERSASGDGGPLDVAAIIRRNLPRE